MNYTQFMTNMKESLLERLGAGVVIDLVSVPKNNGVVMQGFALRRPGEKVVPTIYTEGFYADFLEGRDMEDILTDFLEIYESQGVVEMPDVEFYSDYREVKRRLSLKLVNREKNQTMLAGMPHMEFLDMAVVFYCLVDSPFAGTAAIMIKDDHVQRWGVTVPQLYEDALENSESMLPGTVRSMEEVLARILLKSDIPVWEWRSRGADDFPKLEGVQAEIIPDGIPMLVLTNSRRYLGASCILYRGLLEKFAKQLGRSFYVLPSSVHEVILLPDDRVENAEKLLEMVADVNKTQLAPEDVLSDAVYHYDKESKEIRIFSKF